MTHFSEALGSLLKPRIETIKGKIPKFKCKGKTSLYLTWPEVAIGLQSWWSGEKMNMYIVGRAKTY